MRVLVTGATGFLGRRVALLLRDEGHEVSGLARSDGSARALADLGISAVRADLGDGEGLKAALADLPLDAVMHLAAEIATQRSAEKVWETNKGGTERLYHAVSGIPTLRRFVFASTVVVGEAHGALLTEDTPLVAETTYGKSKQASERMLLDAARGAGFPACLVRPSHVYGNGGWFAELVRDLGRGLFFIPGSGENLWDVIHVDDAAAAVVAVLNRGESGAVYHVVDDTPVTMNDFFTEAARYLGRSSVGHVPVWLARLVKGRDPVAAGVRSARSSNARIKQLGWQPRYGDYRAGLRQTFEEMGLAG